MAFIIALGVIIILLCSASVIKLLQPQGVKSRREPAVYSKASSGRRLKVDKAVKRPKANVTTEQVDNDFTADEFEIVTVDHPKEALPFVATVVKSENLPALISVHLRAFADKPYAGYELLQSLLSAGLRFGTENLFHRHEKKTGIGSVFFSIASCTPEGTFDLSMIGGFSCKGLVLFMKPRDVQDPVKVFELMLQTADQLIQELGGDVLNDRQQLLQTEDVIQTHQQLQRAFCA